MRVTKEEALAVFKKNKGVLSKETHQGAKQSAMKECPCQNKKYEPYPEWDAILQLTAPAPLAATPGK